MVPELTRRVDFHLTRYRGAHDQVGRAWITIDGEQVLDASFYVWMRAYNAAVEEAHRLYPNEEPAYLTMQVGYKLYSRTERATQLLSERAIHETSHLYEAFRSYPSLSIADALASPNPLIRALAMLDRRLGQRTLAKIKVTSDDHPLLRRFYELRVSTKVA
jgi:hypothetical protein